jgi:hypothetical protein
MFGGALLVDILIIAINITGLVSGFKIKKTKITGIILIGCDVALFLAIQLFTITGLVIFVMSGLGFK